VSVTLTTTVHGKLNRIRSCVGQHNIKYFTRFIFYHALFCTIKFIIVLKITVIEFSYITAKYDLHGRGFVEMALFFMRYLGFNYDIFFFLAISGMTSLALTFFFLNISAKYMRNMTINEEFKYDCTRQFFEHRLNLISKYVREKKNPTKDELEKVRKDFAEAENWVKHYKRLFGGERTIPNLFRILFN